MRSRPTPIRGRGPRAAPIDPAAVDLTGSGLVSAFVRDRLGEPPLAGATDRSVVLVSDPAEPRKSRMSDRQQIRKNEAAGYEISRVAGPAATDEQLAASSPSTPRRCAPPMPPTTTSSTPATSTLLASPLTWLITVAGPGGDCAASVAVRSDGFLHYYLSAPPTSTAATRR